MSAVGTSDKLWRSLPARDDISFEDRLLVRDVKPPHKSRVEMIVAVSQLLRRADGEREIVQVRVEHRSCDHGGLVGPVGLTGADAQQRIGEDNPDWRCRCHT